MMGTARKMGSRLKRLVLIERKRKDTLMLMGTMLSMLERRKTRCEVTHLSIVKFGSGGVLWIVLHVFVFFSGCMA